MKLYHGSTVEIPHVDLAKSKPNKDFGRAFYLSDDEQQALEMAQFRAEFEDAAPVVNVYVYSESHRPTDKANKQMKVSQAEFQNMKEKIVKDLISRLMDERGLSMEQAFDAVYTSRLFEKLNDPKTGLFFQSSGYVYSFLTEELQPA